MEILKNSQSEKKDNIKNGVHKNIKENNEINNNNNNIEENNNKYNKEIKEEKKKEEKENNEDSSDGNGGNYYFFYLIYTIISQRNFINLYKLIFILKKKEIFKDKKYLNKIYKPVKNIRIL